MRLRTKDLTMKFEDQVVLDRLNLDFSFNSLAIIGPSGGGKSTFLRVLGGLIEPTSGTFAFDDDWAAFEEDKLYQLRKQIGFVFQSHGLFPHLSALENITLPLIHTFKYSKAEANEKARVLLERFNLEHEKDKYPHMLSGGQQQRIAIIRAVAISPKILLLDEPTSALDPELSAEVLIMLRELAETGMCMIVVTHHLGFAKNATDMVLYMDEQGIKEIAPTTQFFTSPKSEDVNRFLSKLMEF
ncbi:MAG: amino acid ABC transporter ATP-binding protein [Erysipelothrix sp.]|nr:amino acid ABC transporter ATP-binding protein [Erysipelothrix sp.]